MSANTGKAPDFITLSSYPRAIAHVDCDAFFASCEQARDPKLKGLPVVTGKERGIVSCASYEAKALGVARGMRLGEVKRLAPETVILPSDYETYSIYSERVFSILKRFTPDVEEFSMDEAFCDLTGLRRMFRTSYAGIARSIKEAVKEELDISVSVGLSLTKTLAKICSKINKPDGFLAVPGYKLHEFLAGIPLERVCGFGPNTVALLEKCALRCVLDYVNMPLNFAAKVLGKIGIELWHELRGTVVYDVTAGLKEKYLTISKTKTFAPPSGNRDFVKAQLIRNLESAFIKLRRHNLSARKLTAYLRRADFSACGMEARLNRHSSSTLDFTGIAAGLFDAIFEERVSYRSTGVVLSDIKEEGDDSRDLFDDPLKIEAMTRITRAMDDINGSFGKHAVHIAASNIVSKKSGHPRSDLHWRKTELLKGETFRKRLRIPLLKMK